MPYLSPPPEPILRDAIDEQTLKNFRRLIKHFGWTLIPLRTDQKSTREIQTISQFNLDWLHTFFSVYATESEQTEMLVAGYQPRS